MKLAEAIRVGKDLAGVTEAELVRLEGLLAKGVFPATMQEPVVNILIKMQDHDAIVEFCTLWNQLPEAQVIGTMDPGSLVLRAAGRVSRREIKHSDPTWVKNHTQEPEAKDETKASVREPSDQEQLAAIVAQSNEAPVVVQADKEPEAKVKPEPKAKPEAAKPAAKAPVKKVVAKEKPKTTKEVKPAAPMPQAMGDNEFPESMGFAQPHTKRSFKR